MSLNVIVQNLAQLKARYEKTWEVITGNCDSTLFLGGQEESTLEYMSKKIGKETIDIVVHNRSGGKQQSISESNSKAGRELMLPSEIGTMPITDCLLKIRSHNPFYCTKYPIEDHPNYKYLEDHDKNNAFDVKTIRSVSIAEFEAQNQARMLLGAITFGLSIKDNNAGGKVSGLKTLSAGAIAVSVSAILPLFV